jgi:hypothetical protein
MTDLPAGARLLASEINAALPIYMRASSDTTKTSSTALGDATGMTLELEASSTYVMDGYLAYTAGATGDLKVAWTVPTGTTGHWCLYGLSTASTASVGDLDARRITAFGDANTQSIGGSDSLSGSLAALPRLYVVTSTTAGDITMRFAQNTSSGTSTIIRIGTWVRAVKVA